MAVISHDTATGMDLFFEEKDSGDQKTGDFDPKVVDTLVFATV
jgi:hypothetical protein